MNLKEVAEILRKEEERRRREAKKRQAEILALMEEQNLDYQGKLWGEESITALANGRNGGNGYRETDFEAQLVSHNHNPERAVIIKELIELARETIESHFEPGSYQLFCSWLECESWEELAVEVNLTAYNCIQLIKDMVKRIRKYIGTNPSVFPFSDKLDKKTQKAIKNKVATKRMFEGKSAPADLENRVYLDDIVPGWKEMSLDSLWEKVKSKGYQVSRTAIWRARKRYEISGEKAWFMKPGWQLGGKKIYLSEEDKSLTNRLLAYKYGISHVLAGQAKRRGYFHIHPQNRDRVIPQGRDISAFIAEEEAKKAEKQSEGFIKVLIDPKDWNLSVKELVDKYCLFCDSIARNIRSRKAKSVRMSRTQYRQYCAKHGLPCEVSKAQDGSE